MSAFEWSQEMKAAAMRDAERVCDLEQHARFLVERLREFEGDMCECNPPAREWMGHVWPALERMEALLNARQKSAKA